MTDSWNLISAGPSREHIRNEHLIEGAPVVTVNRAIDVMDRGIKVHFAAFADGPVGYWKPLGLERYVMQDPTIQLWVPLRQTKRIMKVRDVPGIDKSADKAFLDQTVDVPGPSIMHLWDKVLPACIGARELPWGNVPDATNPSVQRMAFTTLSALERIIMFRPKMVRIISADMLGSYVDGWTEEDCKRHEWRKVADGKSPVALDRWKHERTTLLRTIKKAEKALGVKCEFYTPEK